MRDGAIQTVLLRDRLLQAGFERRSFLHNRHISDDLSVKLYPSIYSSLELSMVSPDFHVVFPAVPNIRARGTPLEPDDFVQLLVEKEHSQFVHPLRAVERSIRPKVQAGFGPVT